MGSDAEDSRSQGVESAAAERSGVETWVGRGDHVESVHQAAVTVVERSGKLHRWGSSHRSTYLRSVAKPFQTLALLKAGVHQKFGLTDEQLAVLCASHAGEQYHHDLVGQLLAKHGLSPEQLRCGIHPPFSGYERRRRLASGQPLSVLGNNCSGKHTGMLLFARHLGADPESYLEPSHPVQQAVRSIFERLAETSVDPSTCGIDGCGAPTYFVPLDLMAHAFWRLGDGAFLAEAGLLDEKARLERAITAHPRAFSGEGRLPYRFSGVLPSGLCCKEGAEGVFVVWGEPGAVVIKSLDGHERGYRYALPEILFRLGWLDAARREEWLRIDPPIVRNVAGRAVGSIECLLAGRHA